MKKLILGTVFLILSIPSVFAADPVRTLQTMANNFVAQNLVNHLTGVSVTAQCNNLNMVSQLP